MYCVARAYSLALASVVAPFEYVALPISALWGFLLWLEIPTLTTWAGTAQTLLSGMYILYRERKERAVQVAHDGTLISPDSSDHRAVNTST